MELKAIQAAIQEQGLDGWLFFDHHHRDALADRILGLDENLHSTRRWYYYIPAKGEPRGMVHKIEPNALATLPGAHLQYSRWTEQAEKLRELLTGARTVAMQYSPNCEIPYVSMVDAGTVELVRGMGVEVVSSANLVQLFEARWSEAQLQMHLEAGRLMDRIRQEAFVKIQTALRSGEPVDEWIIQNFLMSRFAESGLVTDHPPIVAVNANASNPHYGPTQAHHSPIQRGDVVLIDMWSKLDKPAAVFYDITWTGFCGDAAPDRVQNVFRTVRDARDAAVDLVRRSVAARQPLKGFQVDDATREHIQSKGFGDYFIHRTGHSIGTSVHGAGANMDNYETHDVRDVVPRTCFSVEPGIYLPQFGIRSEVNVYVGEEEAKVTGEIQTELILIN